ncbi:hypothetical protein N658DRAFT_466275 [Parathielavia hyrcaniae]|uniref:AAA+ ATPase domain-containing protein n=1 Tax=Parathielavia hyrcaniae TaxID=113614 RepID=A0AAN6T3Y3_9PEZI|nr:hypothetical protein N658DRAFT_466275 [Parathielavia hyrcaniae]
MAHSEEATLSKLLEVLSRIDIRLEALDQRFQAFEHSRHHLEGSDPADNELLRGITRAVPGDLGQSLAAVYKLGADGKPTDKLLGFVVEDGDLLSLLLQISSPCLSRHVPEFTDPDRKVFKYPFTELRPYLDILEYLFGKPGPVDKVIAALVPELSPTIKLEDGIANLLHLCRASWPQVLERDSNVARGIVSFTDLPNLYPPGMLLIGSGEADEQQVVEVSLCDMSSEACVVEAWHFRWDGKAFSRTSCRFHIDHYSGTRPINRLPFHPLIGLGAVKSVGRLEQLMDRNRTNLDTLRLLSQVEFGDYPLCSWSSRPVKGMEYRVRSAEHVILDPEGFAMQLHREGDPLASSSFNCYCTACTTPIGLDALLARNRFLLLAPTRLEGFRLESKSWSAFDIADLDPHTDQPIVARALRSINLDKTLFASLKSDFEAYFSKRRNLLDMLSNGDFVVSLGRGLILQFHGPSGSGKTSVAWALAAQCQRPLLVIRPADLGLDSTVIDKNLSLYSELAIRWGAVLAFLEADNMLQRRELNMAQGVASPGALLDHIGRFSGVMIFVSDRLSQVDYALQPHIKLIEFSLPSAETIKNMLCDRVIEIGQSSVESRDEILEWITTVADNSMLTGQESLAILAGLDQAEREGRTVTLRDIIKAYTAETGRPDEWDFVSDLSPFHTDGEGSVETYIPPEISELQVNAFGMASAIPDDGRLCFTLSPESFSIADHDTAQRWTMLLSELTRRLLDVGDFQVIDWGWPRGLWTAKNGCVYRLRQGMPPHSSNPVFDTPQQMWEEEGFTFGLRHLLEADEHGAARCGKPWRRLVRGLPLEEDLLHGIAFLDYHSDVCDGWQGLTDTSATLQMFHARPMDREAPTTDPIHWTIVCLIPPEPWLSPRDDYKTCDAPNLRAQAASYVAKALSEVAWSWRKVLLRVDRLVGRSDEVLRHQDHLQDILFDDDAFSTSKRYFWVISFIHEAVKLLDNATQQWAHYQKRSIEPYRTGFNETGREAHWYKESQRVLRTAEKTGEEACEDLKLLRQEFSEILDRVTVLRDGLGENVKLLTFVSIFFLPLGLCVAIWSINESYSRTDLGIATAAVAAATYCITLNLNNLARAGRKLYAPRRRALVEQMGRDPDPGWKQTGHRFQAFQRSEKGQQNKPSEWTIVLFVLRQAVLYAMKAVSSRGEKKKERENRVRVGDERA